MRSDRSLVWWGLVLSLPLGWGEGTRLGSSTLVSEVSGHGRTQKEKLGDTRKVFSPTSYKTHFWPSVECSGMIAFGEHIPRNHIKEFFPNVLCLSLIHFQSGSLEKLKHTERNHFTMLPNHELGRTQWFFVLGLRIFRENTKLKENRRRGNWFDPVWRCCWGRWLLGQSWWISRNYMEKCLEYGNSSRGNIKGNKSIVLGNLK